jgi:hypothetical protein
MKNMDREISFSTNRSLGTAPGQIPRAKNRLSEKHALFFVLGLMTLFVLYHNDVDGNRTIINRRQLFAQSTR